MQEVGYNHGKTMFSSWERGGLVSKLFQDKKREERELKRQSQEADKLVSRIPEDLLRRST